MDRWKPFPRKATPAGLLYTPSMPMAASRAGFLRKIMFWFVFVSMPPANELAQHAAKRAARANFDLFILILFK